MKLLRKHPALIILLLIILVLLLWSLWGNTALMVTKHTVSNEKIPDAFDDFKIVQVSDLHNAEFGENNEKLLALLEETQPDMIAITGDLVDSRRTDLEIAVAFAAEAVKLAPTYYVPGNHEARLPEEYAALKTALSDLGVVVLENESLLLEKETACITLTGLMDPDFGDPSAALPELTSENYQVVLSHRPELLALYAEYGLDLVFTGHAHGGQFRLPFIGGLFAPHQGFFPKYDSGVFTQDHTQMVVSRGLGNSLFPLRFNNRPELIVVTLESV